MGKSIRTNTSELRKFAKDLDTLSKQLNECMQKLEKDTVKLSESHKDYVNEKLTKTMDIHILDLKKLSAAMEKYCKITLKAEKFAGRYLNNSRI